MSPRRADAQVDPRGRRRPERRPHLHGERRRVAALDAGLRPGHADAQRRGRRTRRHADGTSRVGGASGRGGGPPGRGGGGGSRCRGRRRPRRRRVGRRRRGRRGSGRYRQVLTLRPRRQRQRRIGRESRVAPGPGHDGEEDPGRRGNSDTQYRKTNSRCQAEIAALPQPHTPQATEPQPAHAPRVRPCLLDCRNRSSGACTGCVLRVHSLFAFLCHNDRGFPP